MNPRLSTTEIDGLRDQLRESIHATPSVALPTPLAHCAAAIYAKMELWQVTGSFKARGALANVAEIPENERDRGITAVSAGNHAIAAAFAAQQFGMSAKVVMTASAPAYRVARCRDYGAQVVIAETVHDAFDRVQAIVAQEQRHFVHPFEGLTTALATAGVGREFALDITGLDAVIVPVGGGGLAAGVSAAVKLTQPDCRVFGVEPVGADSMSRSFAAGAPVHLDAVDTIADSLGAPMALPISFALCKDNIDRIATVHDDEIRAAMRTIYESLSLAVEPACAAAIAALHGPLQDELAGKRVGVIFCGSNIDIDLWSALVAS